MRGQVLPHAAASGSTQTIKVRGWAFDVSLLYHWKAAGFGCEEVNTDLKDPQGGKLRILRAVPLMFGSLIGVWLVNSRVGGWISPRSRQQLHTRLSGLASGYLRWAQLRSDRRVSALPPRTSVTRPDHARGAGLES